jgi:putative ABC transport system substrate-binding protein
MDASLGNTPSSLNILYWFTFDAASADTSSQEITMKLRNLMLAVALLALLAGTAQAKTPVIAVNQFVEHPALDATLKGIQDDLKENNVAAEFKVFNAQGSMPTANLIATKIADVSPDLVVAIATPSAQASASLAAKNDKMGAVPLVFTAITDPVLAGLVKDLGHPGGMTTGVSNQMPADKPVSMLQRLMPKLKTLGIIYNAGEMNSVSNVKRIKAAAAAVGIEVVDATVANSSEVTAAAQSLVGKVDAAFVPTDNTVVSNFEAAVKVCRTAKLPLFCMDIDSVKRGAIAAIAFDYYEHGKQTGAMVRRILAGAKPADMPVEFQKKLNFAVNPKSAESMGFTLSEEIIKSADKIVE